MRFLYCYSPTDRRSRSVQPSSRGPIAYTWWDVDVHLLRWGYFSLSVISFFLRDCLLGRNGDHRRSILNISGFSGAADSSCVSFSRGFLPLSRVFSLFRLYGLSFWFFLWSFWSLFLASGPFSLGHFVESASNCSILVRLARSFPTRVSLLLSDEARRQFLAPSIQ
jgi:hypothetical protein